MSNECLDPNLKLIIRGEKHETDLISGMCNDKLAMLEVLP
jgi:hypothetical protein